jgi:BirA family biotin operon repressor/biotin-[acetyl-CoA-carboxylase] ligase
MQNLREILEKTFIADAEHHAVVGSTNDLAIRRAAEPELKLPHLILADCQTAGRGRGSNRWWTGPGSLAFSLLLGPNLAAAAGSPNCGERADSTSEIGHRHPAAVSLAAGTAIVEALAPLAPGHELGIHWPNDVMLDGGKLAGILIEVLGDGKHVIGIGINTNSTAADAPEEIRRRVVTLRDVTGRMHDSKELLIAILSHLQRQLAELASSPESVARRTDALCLQRGKQLRIAQGAMQFDGRCLGIAADGALLLEIDGRAQAVYSGVVTEP